MLALALALLLGAGAPDAPQRADAETMAELQAMLATLRESADLEPLAISDPLRGLADRRAAEIAARPASRRLPHPVPFDDELDDWPDLKEYRVAERVVVVPGSLGGGELIRAAWDNPEAGALALDAATIAVGLGAWFAPDGSLVLVALFGSDEVAGRETLERLLLDEINEVRRANGLVALTADERLRAVAREHSETMLAGGFLGHESPDGSEPADRVRAAGIGFRLVGENVARSLRPLGAVHGVVDEWMASPGHRANILTPDFRETAVGAAVAEDGATYVTQLFLER